MISKFVVVRNLRIHAPRVHVTSSQEHQLLEEPASDFPVSEYSHFPVLLNSDGTVWEHGSRYLLYRIRVADFEVPARSTLRSISCDIRAYKQFCDLNTIDYLVAERKISAPTRRYRNHLNSQHSAGELQLRTIARKMSRVVDFYRWLQEEEDIQFSVNLWESVTNSILYLDKQGFSHQKTILSNDVSSVRVCRDSSHRIDSIQDGGTLFPLSLEEQKALVKALSEIKNTEMTLGFLIALCTGARIQTIFTLRLHHFDQQVQEGALSVQVAVGPGTGSDTKKGRNFILFFPVWLYQKVQIYIHSERWKLRQTKFQYPCNDSSRMRYVFLTTRSNPYYAANDDPNSILTKYPPDGGAIRGFISDSIKPVLTQFGTPLNFKFHDLRATFGMNLVRFSRPLLDAGQTSYLAVLDLVRRRMSHVSIDTTEQYLKFDEKKELVLAAQDGFEEYLSQILGGK